MAYLRQQLFVSCLLYCLATVASSITGNMKVLISPRVADSDLVDVEKSLTNAVAALALIPASYVLVTVQSSQTIIKALYEADIPATYSETDVESRLASATEADFEDKLRVALDASGIGYSTILVQAFTTSGATTGDTTVAPTGDTTSAGTVSGSTVETSALQADSAAEDDGVDTHIIVLITIAVVFLPLLSLQFYRTHRRQQLAARTQVVPAQDIEPPAPIEVHQDGAPPPYPASSPSREIHQEDDRREIHQDDDRREAKSEGTSAESEGTSAESLFPEAKSEGTNAEEFEGTKFLKFYKESKAAQDFFTGFAHVNEFIEAVGVSYNLPAASVGKYKKDVSDALMAKIKDIDSSQVRLAGAYIWTTAVTLSDGKRNRELCSYINEALRSDTSPMIDKVVPIVRMINELIVTVARGGEISKWPSGDKTYRGIGLPEAERSWFTEGKIYRVPMFLATSFQQDTAQSFMRRMSNSVNKPTLFIFNFDPEDKCKHANYLGDVTAVKGEDEFLLPPYSGFQVEGVQWSRGQSVVNLKVFSDNHCPELSNVPLAKWH